ncbi:MAG: hypothetical protein WCI54_03510 [Bacteroidia bacterium]
MKHKLTIFGMAGLAAMLFTSPTYSQSKSGEKETSTPRHIKMIKIENGKTTKLDTLVAGNDVFIFNGDTVGGKELGKHINPSGFDDMEHKSIIVRKMIKDGENEQMFIMKGPDTEHCPPMPPHMMMWKGQHTGRVIDLNDPNITSFKIKDLKGGLEKIEIIRKKSTEPEETTFDFQGDDQLMPPPPPPLPPGSPATPEKIREYNDGKENIKIIEKSTKVDGKDGKEIKVEVESKETK